MKIVSQKDFVVGLSYMAVGGAFAVGASRYAMGDTVRIGPGYFPFWLGVVLAFVGALVLITSLHPRAEPERLRSWALRPLFIVLACVVAFAVLLPVAGLVLASLVLVI